MAEILELSDKELKITLMNMLRALVEKVGIMQEQMGNVNRKTVSVKRIKKTC